MAKSLGIVLLTLLAAALANAQNASISGRAVDPTGAVAPGVTVQALNRDTGVRHGTTTNKDGFYLIPELSPGAYQITARATGFKTLTRDGIVLEVAQKVRVDLELEIGAYSEKVTVSDDTTMLNVSDSSVGNVIGTSQIEQMPLNGRNFQQLSALVPGALPNYGGRDSDQGGVSLSGTRSFDNTFILDGAENNPNTANFSSNMNLTVTPNLDAVQEFKIQSGSFDARYGNTPGGVINIVTKSGSNELHGTGYDYLRNSVFNSNTWQNNQQNIARPVRIRNQFGGVIGGPIYLPKLYDGHDRTFFFFDDENVREKLPPSFVNLTVPDANMRRGDFSEFLPGGGLSGLQAFRLAAPYNNNVLPRSALNPAALKLASYYPLPNVAGTLNYRDDLPNTFDSQNIGGRLDHRFSDHDSIYGRYTENAQTNNASTWSQLLGPSVLLNAHGNLGVIGETHIFSPYVVNTLRASYSHSRQFRLLNGSSEDLLADSGISGIPPQPGMPTGLLNFSGLPGIQAIGRRSGYYNDTGNTRALSDSLEWVVGTHHLQFGGGLNRLRMAHFESQDPRGEFDFFAQNAVDLDNNPQTVGFAQFLTGSPSRVSFSTSGDIIYQQSQWNGYAQDSWRIAPSLVLNFGLRYDRFAPVTERDDNQANFDVGRGVLVYASDKKFTPPPSLANIPLDFNSGRDIIKTDTANFAPRVGFAYSPGHATAVRGGYGIFYGFREIGPWSFPSPGYNPPFNIIYSVAPTPLSSGYKLDPLADPNAQFQIASMPSHLKTPRVHQWNVSLQHVFSHNITVEATYSGSAGRDLYTLVYFNQAVPGTTFDDLKQREPFPYIGDTSQQTNNNGFSNYNALLVRAEKRFSSGISFLASYTYSHTLDNASDANQGTVHAGDTFRDPRHTDWEYGNSDFDARNRFVFSGLFDLPFGRGKRFGGSMSRVLDAFVGNWELSGIWTAQSGYWFTPFGVNDSCFCNDGNANSLRPDVVLGQLSNSGPRTPAEWFNTSAFTINVAAGRHGNAGRNIILGPGFQNIDLGLHKVFTLTERFRLQFRAEFFDALNHPNFDSPDLSYRDSTVGEILTSRTAREGQLALKLIF